MPKDIKIGDGDFQGVIDLRNNDPMEDSATVILPVQKGDT